MKQRKVLLKHRTKFNCAPLLGMTISKEVSKKSGWEHSLLFVAELSSFQPALPEDIVEEMDKVR